MHIGTHLIIHVLIPYYISLSSFQWNNEVKSWCHRILWYMQSCPIQLEKKTSRTYSELCDWFPPQKFPRQPFLLQWHAIHTDFHETRAISGYNADVWISNRTDGHKQLTKMLQKLPKCETIINKISLTCQFSQKFKQFAQQSMGNSSSQLRMSLSSKCHHSLHHHDLILIPYSKYMYIKY